MSSTNKTTNYNLSQFVGTDVPSYLGDYNGDMSKIDKAIGDVANSQGSVEQSVVGLTADVQGLSTQVSGVSTSLQQLQTTVAQIDSGYKQADTALSQRITANANNIQTNTTAIEGINTTIGTEDISGIGDGTIKGSISNINSSLNGLLMTKNFSGTTNGAALLDIECPEGYEPVYVHLNTEPEKIYTAIISNHSLRIIQAGWDDSHSIPYIKYIANESISGTVLYLNTEHKLIN